MDHARIHRSETYAELEQRLGQGLGLRLEPELELEVDVAVDVDVAAVEGGSRASTIS